MILDNDKLKEHEDHTIVVARYRDENGEVYNISVECESCHEVIGDMEL